LPADGVLAGGEIVETRQTSSGVGWITFAAVMMMLAGMSNVLNGLWALDRKDLPIDTVVFDDNLKAWGWFFVIMGIVLVIAGFALFNNSQWARWVGIAVAAFSALINMTWLFQYPISSLIHMTLAVLVIYALAVYGERETV
jgi:hypothetical protein